MKGDPMDQLLTPAEVANMLGISEITLKRYRLDGSGPQPVFISPRIIRYNPQVVADWLTEREEAHDSGS